MAFILIPFILILLSAIGIFVIIWKKIPYLKKLSVADVQLGPNIWTDFFPELSGKINTIQLKHYREVWLSELEKLLRRLKVLFLKMDRISSSLIKRIRRFTEDKHENLQTPPSVTKVKETSGIKTQESVKQETEKDMKKEEQRLIIEIAKDPKNSSLYEVLGDLYAKMGNFSDAKESYEAVIGLNPDNEEIKKKLSSTLEMLIQK